MAIVALSALLLPPGGVSYLAWARTHRREAEAGRLVGDDRHTSARPGCWGMTPPRRILAADVRGAALLGYPVWEIPLIALLGVGMSAVAKPLGIEIVTAEQRLDRAFASGSIDRDTLRAQTAAIAELQGKLRAVHLAAHLETRALLTPDQIARYDALRGYGGAAPAGHDHGGHRG
jgi:hypothetical protein